MKSLSYGGYAAVVRLSLDTLGLPVDLGTQQVSVTTGNADALMVKGGEIRFISPEDPGANTEVVLKVALANSDVLVPVEIQSARPTAFVLEVEPDESGNTPSSVPNLRVVGLGEGNVLLANELALSADGAPQLDPSASSATIFLPQSSTVVDIAPYWAHDPATNQLRISARNMQEILNGLPAGDMVVDVGLSSVDGTLGAAWTFPVYKGSAALTGSVVDANGAAVTSLAGRKIALRGLNTNRTRRVLTIGGAGQFNSEGLPAGTYELALLDTGMPNFWMVSFAIEAGSTQISVTLPYAPLPAAVATLARISKAGVSQLRARVTQNGPPTMQRSGAAARGRLARSGVATGPGCTFVDSPSGAGGTYTATAAAENQTSTCAVSYTLPKGTLNVGVKLTVTSMEYPVYSTQKSEFNDTWSYALSGLTGISSASGVVNDSHYTRGSFTRAYCIDTATLTKDNEHAFSANLSATNIGDSNLDTRVVMEVKENCDPVLNVTKAEFLQTSSSGYRVVRPMSTNGNLAGNYISLPTTTAVQSWGIPLQVEYTPKEAQITRARIGVVSNGVTTLSDVDVSVEIGSRSEGKLSFANLKIPSGIAVNRFTGNVNVVLELQGTYNSSTLTSEAAEGQIQHDNSPLFMPLFLAADFLGAARRFGQNQPEPGLDSWATHGTISYLSGNAYRFNDVSALHIAQLANGRSALGHSGHSDGTQVDLRYADGAGGFSDQLGGASDGSFIRAMLLDAAGEVQAGGTAPKPRLAQAIAWITANRALLESESVNARKLYAGPSWMKLALHDGKFPNGTLIPALANGNTTQQPGIGLWTSKPGNLSYVDPHLHHWHISRLTH